MGLEEAVKSLINRTIPEDQREAFLDEHGLVELYNPTDYTANDVIEHVGDLEDVKELQRIRTEEEEDKDRTTVIEAIDERLGDLS